MDVPGTPATGSRRDEDIALDLMKFIAMTTGYGRTTSGGGGEGLRGTGGAAKPEDYAAHLLNCTLMPASEQEIIRPQVSRRGDAHQLPT